MIFDVLKGIVLVIFTTIIFIVGFFAEIICTPLSRYKDKLLIDGFISELWRNSYKH